jgi:Tetratricopeptide repeat
MDRGAGEPATARDQYATLLPVVERVFGAEHPETLTVRFNMARWTGKAGDPATARDQFTELLSIRMRVLGPEHPDTLTIRRNLARWTRQAEEASGRPGGAAG